jgi:hypothetical protein
MDGGGILVLLTVAAIGLAIYAVQRHQSERETAKTAPPKSVLSPQTEMAIIKEEIEITGWGTFSRIGLTVAIGIETFALLGASNIFQHMQAGVAFIGSAILFGLGVALGRTRTYRVYHVNSSVKKFSLPE